MKFLRLTIFMAHSMHIINMYPNIRKISATVYKIFKKRKTGSSEMSNVSSEHPYKGPEKVNLNNVKYLTNG